MKKIILLAVSLLLLILITGCLKQSQKNSLFSVNDQVFFVEAFTKTIDTTGKVEFSEKIKYFSDKFPESAKESFDTSKMGGYL